MGGRNPEVKKTRISVDVPMVHVDVSRVEGMRGCESLVNMSMVIIERCCEGDCRWNETLRGLGAGVGVRVREGERGVLG